MYYGIDASTLSQVGMAAQKGTVERLRQSGVGALSNAFGMAAFLESKEDLLCDHPSLFIILYNYILCVILYTSHITIFIPMPLCLFLFRYFLEDSTIVLSNPWEYHKLLDL